MLSHDCERCWEIFCLTSLISLKAWIRYYDFQVSADRGPLPA